MAHYAKVVYGVVEQVIVAEQDVIDSGVFGDGWVQTSYNTYGGVHKNGGTPLRKNYAGVGYVYDKVRDAFIPPKPFPSWALNEDTCLWDAPTAKPTDDQLYYWDEVTLSWVVKEEIELTDESVTTITLSTNEADTIVSADTVIVLDGNEADTVVGADTVIVLNGNEADSVVSTDTVIVLDGNEADSISGGADSVNGAY